MSDAYAPGEEGRLWVVLDVGSARLLQPIEGGPCYVEGDVHQLCSTLRRPSGEGSGAARCRGVRTHFGQFPTLQKACALHEPFADADLEGMRASLEDVPPGVAESLLAEMLYSPAETAGREIALQAVEYMRPPSRLPVREALAAALDVARQQMMGVTSGEVEVGAADDAADIAPSAHSFASASVSNYSQCAQPRDDFPPLAAAAGYDGEPAGGAEAGAGGGAAAAAGAGPGPAADVEGRDEGAERGPTERGGRKRTRATYVMKSISPNHPVTVSITMASLDEANANWRVAVSMKCERQIAMPPELKSALNGYGFRYKSGRGYEVREVSKDTVRSLYSSVRKEIQDAMRERSEMYAPWRFLAIVEKYGKVGNEVKRVTKTALIEESDPLPPGGEGYCYKEKERVIAMRRLKAV